MIQIRDRVKVGYHRIWGNPSRVNSRVPPDKRKRTSGSGSG
jgi:hypothetical protein